MESGSVPYARSMTGLRRAAGLVLLLIVAGSAASAQALDPPAILYREGVSENEPLGPWLPLDGAHVNGLGFLLGTRSQAVPAGDGAVLYRPKVLAVPDGHPDQTSSLDPTSLCTSNAFPAGMEFVLGIVRYEGPGSYTIRLEANLRSLGAGIGDCSGGPASTATFTIDPAVTLDLLMTHGVLLSSNQSDPVAKIPSLPTGGAGETQCARNGVIGADGSVNGLQRTALLGSPIEVGDIVRTGRWTCVARARATGSQAADGPHYTRWSPPVSFDAISPFSSTLSVPDASPKRYTITIAKMPPGSEGGTLTLRISPGTGCPHVAAKTLHARVTSKRTTRFTFTLPEKDKVGIHRPKGVTDYGWLFRLAFSGTRFVRPAHSTERGYVTSKNSYQGHYLGFPGVTKAGCIRGA